MLCDNLKLGVGWGLWGGVGIRGERAVQEGGDICTPMADSC